MIFWEGESPTLSNTELELKKALLIKKACITGKTGSYKVAQNGFKYIFNFLLVFTSQNS